MKTRDWLMLLTGLFLIIYVVYRLGQSHGQAKAERQQQKEDLRALKDDVRVCQARLSSVENDLFYFRRIRDFVKNIFNKAPHLLTTGH